MCTMETQYAGDAGGRVLPSLVQDAPTSHRVYADNIDYVNYKPSEIT